MREIAPPPLRSGRPRGGGEAAVAEGLEAVGEPPEGLEGPLPPLHLQHRPLLQPLQQHLGPPRAPA